jgi:hypothetical protein
MLLLTPPHLKAAAAEVMVFSQQGSAEMPGDCQSQKQ